MLYGNQEQQDMSLQVVILHHYAPADGNMSLQMVILRQYVPADGKSSSVCPCRWQFFVNMSLQMVAVLRS